MDPQARECQDCRPPPGAGRLPGMFPPQSLHEEPPAVTLILGSGLQHPESRDMRLSSKAPTGGPWSCQPRGHQTRERPHGKLGWTLTTRRRPEEGNRPVSRAPGEGAGGESRRGCEPRVALSSRKTGAFPKSPTFPEKREARSLGRTGKGGGGAQGQADWRSLQIGSADGQGGN